MMYETHPVEKHQAAMEAVMLLQETGFRISDVDIEASDLESSQFSLSVDLSLPKNERPLDVLGP